MKPSLYLIFLLLSSSLSAQQSWYVSADNGNDNNSGSLSAPFASIQKALDTMSDGDSCFIRSGRYHENLLINNRQNLYFAAYQSEEVILDGTQVLNPSWTQHSPNIYKSSIPQDIWQLFVDGEEQVMARWPNAQFHDNSIYDYNNWATGIPSQGSASQYVVDANLLAQSNLNLQGAIAVLNIGSFKTFARKITQHSSGQDSFSFNSIPAGAFRAKHHHAFVEGKLNLLDTINEWFYDSSTQVLYVYGDKTGMELRGKTQSYAFEITNSQQIELYDLNFFATTFVLENSSYCHIDSCKLAFPNCSKRMLHNEGMPQVTSIKNNNSKHNKITRCLFEYTDGEALRISGDSNQVENSYFHHIDWSVANAEALGLTINVNGQYNNFLHNTIRFTGASATINPGQYSTVAYNDISQTGKVQSDGSMIQCTRNNVQDAQLHHNWLHDAPKYALRFDAPANDPSVAGRNGRVHHNVVWRTNGMMIKGDEHVVAHNTCFDNYKNGIILLTEDSSNNQTITRNNAAQRIGGHRSQAPSATYPIPGIFDHNWNGYLQSNGLVSLLTDTATWDFIPLANTALVDSGVVLSIAHTTIGTAPDLGAYERGATPWTAGVDWAVDFYPWTSGSSVISNTEMLPQQIDSRIFPNPSHDYFTVEVPEQQSQHRIRLYNQLGQIVLEQAVEQQHYRIQVQILPKGMYFLQLENEHWSESHSLIIQ